MHLICLNFRSYTGPSKIETIFLHNNSCFYYVKTSAFEDFEPLPLVQPVEPHQEVYDARHILSRVEYYKTVDPRLEFLEDPEILLAYLDNLPQEEMLKPKWTDVRWVAVERVCEKIQMLKICLELDDRRPPWRDLQISFGPKKDMTDLKENVDYYFPNWLRSTDSVGKDLRGVSELSMIDSQDSAPLASLKTPENINKASVGEDLGRINEPLTNHIRDFVAISGTEPPENIGDLPGYDVLLPYFEALARENWSGYGTYNDWVLSERVLEWFLDPYRWSESTDFLPLP